MEGERGSFGWQGSEWGALDLRSPALNVPAVAGQSNKSTAFHCWTADRACALVQEWTLWDQPAVHVRRTGQQQNRDRGEGRSQLSCARREIMRLHPGRRTLTAVGMAQRPGVMSEGKISSLSIFGARVPRSAGRYSRARRGNRSGGEAASEGAWRRRARQRLMETPTRGTSSHMALTL